MIKRYSVREVSNIFSDSSKYSIWLEIELLVLKYLKLNGTIPESDYTQMEHDLLVIPSQIRDKEKIFNHDVVAFINYISDTTDSRSRKWIHYGLTSSDLVDTGNSVMIKRSNDVLVRKVEALLSRLRRMAKSHRHTYFPNRKDGFSIDGASSFGHRFARCYSEIRQSLRDLEKYRRHVECASISGSMGIFSHTPTDLQDFVAKEMGLHSAPCSTQVLSRDRYYRYFELINRMVQSIHSVCIDLRLMTRTEVGEISEAFYSTQIGSSSMPHKRNPISLENICGLARLFDAYCSVTSKNIPIWLERDISHSSADRVVFLDGITTAIQIIKRFERLLTGLQVFDATMRENIERNQYLVYRRYIAKAIHRSSDCELPMAEIEKRLAQMNETAKEEGITLREVFSQSEWGQDVKELFDLSSHLSFLDDFYSRTFWDDAQRKCFDNVFYREEEIENSISSIANTLNSKYHKGSKEVQLFAIKDESVVFISRLLPQLNFPVELHTIDLTSPEMDLQSGRNPKITTLQPYRSHVENREVAIVGCLLKNQPLTDFLSKGLRKFGAKGIYVVSLFSGLNMKVDLTGLKLPHLTGIAGFGIGNSEGLFRNCGFIGKLKVNFF